ncbi:MAG: hypothetical protein KGS61_21240, partial [Verrucomicrobia bacterium]|nr:hypothetical protein [Verrucomicrobiota bacterium]
WNDTNGVSTVWVAVPALSGTNDFIWAYWGDPAPTNALPSTNVWVPNYTLVWHMKEGALPFADSTSQYPATNGVAPAAVPGLVGLGGAFTGNAYLDPGPVDLGDAFSLSAWVNIASTADNIQAVWVNSKGGWNADGCQFFVNTYNTHDGVLHCNTGNGTTGNDTTSAAGAVSPGQWHQVTAVVDRSAARIRLYVDGLSATASGGAVSDFANQSDLNLGRFTDTAFPMNGLVDEVRIASSTNSAAWVWASYRTVAANSTFQSYSAVNGAAGVTLNVQVTAGQPVLAWTQGTLQSVGQLGGTWTDVTGATSPYTVPVSGNQQFYRLRVP